MGITIYATGQIDLLGIGYPVGDMSPVPQGYWYDLPDTLHYWRLVRSLPTSGIICVAWSPGNVHHAWDVYLWPCWFTVSSGVYGWGEQLEWVDDSVYVSHRIKSVPDDLIPKPLYWLDRDWNWAWDITDRVHMLVWWPESLSLPWYQ